MDSVKIDDITISIIREAYPRELFKFFKENGYEVIKPFDGIYYIKKDGFFDTQIIVSQQLMGEAHVWMKSLTESMQYNNAQQLIGNIGNLTGNAEKEYGDSVLQVAMQANPVSFGIWKKEDTNMCEALRQLMKPEIDEMLNEALNNQKLKEAKQLINCVKNAAKNFNITIEAACRALEIPMEDYRNAENFINGIDNE